jgi:hypothetical protein
MCGKLFLNNAPFFIRDLNIFEFCAAELGTNPPWRFVYSAKYSLVSPPSTHPLVSKNLLQRILENKRNSNCCQELKKVATKQRSH